MKKKRQIMVVVVKAYQFGGGGSEESKGKLGKKIKFCCFRDLTIKMGTILKMDKKLGGDSLEN